MPFTKEQHEAFMRRAIELSRQGSMIEKTGGVFGCVIVDKEGKIVGEGFNRVIKDHDPTSHAEMNAIRDAAKQLGRPHLDGCSLYTSAECCPMCLCAAYWAHIEHIYYAAKIEDARQYGNFADDDYLAEVKKEPKDRKIKYTELLRNEAVAVWKEFHAMPNRAHY